MKYLIQEQFGVDGGVAFLYFLGMLMATMLLVIILARIGWAFCKICGEYIVPILICAVGVCYLLASWAINEGVVIAVSHMILGLIFLFLGIKLTLTEIKSVNKRLAPSTHTSIPAHTWGFKLLD